MDDGIDGSADSATKEIDFSEEDTSSSSQADSASAEQSSAANSPQQQNQQSAQGSAASAENDASQQQARSQSSDKSAAGESSATNSTTMTPTNSTSASNSAAEQTATGQASAQSGELQQSVLGSATRQNAADQAANASASAAAIEAINAAMNNGGGASTRSEQVAELDQKLDRSMGDFDGMILSEREYIQTRGARAGSEREVEAAATGPLFDDVLNGQRDSSLPSPQTAEASSSGTASMPVVNSKQRQGDYAKANAVFTPPADIPSGNDDDVVARQIREAAMQEPDPALREKLWQEYRKYKNKGK